MKVGVTSYSFLKYAKQTNCGYFEMCDISKGLGFDGIEFIGLNSLIEGADQGRGEAELAAGIKEHCAKIGLEIVAYTVGANFLEDDAAAEVARVKGCVDVASALGAKVMRHDSAWGPRGTFGYGYRDAIAEIAPLIREVADYAASKGIKTCTENHGRFFQAPERLRELIRAVNNPNYGWLVDIGNFMGVDADVLEAVEIAAPYAFHVHVKDNLFKPGCATTPVGWDATTGGNWVRATVPGHGDVPIQQCVNILKASGYGGYLSLEFEGWEDSMQALKSGYAFLRGLA